MKIKRKWNRFALVLTALAIFAFVPGVNAACPPGVVEPLLSGPENTNNGFPLWIMDQTGLALQICLDTAVGGCFFDPLDPANPFSVQVGFGPEAFWWLAGASIDVTGGGIAELGMAAEAAWAAEVPNDGDQFPFTRLRIRIDTPGSGNVVRIVNTATIEFPMYACVEPYHVDPGMKPPPSVSSQGGRGSLSHGEQNVWDSPISRRQW